MGRVFAAADIGSNTAHLLVAEVHGIRMKRLANESDWLSLGEIVSRLGRIPKPLEDRLVATVATFKETAAQLRAERLYVFATEAMRQADNCEDICRRVRTELAVVIDIITPAREAELSLAGILPEIGDSGPLLLVEAGGGSVQVARWDGKAVASEISLPLGTGALIAKAEITQPSSTTQRAELDRLISEGTSAIKDLTAVPRVVACGGVARGIWRAIHPDGHPAIHAEELRHLAWATHRLKTDQIVSRYRVKSRRATTLLPGSLVYLKILQKFSHEEMFVSEFGVREGAIFEMASGQGAACPA